MTGPRVMAGGPADETTVFGIDRDRRRALVAATTDPALNGIDHVEVLSNRPDSPSYVPQAPRQRTLAVHLLRGPVPEDLVAGPDGLRVVVLGGVRADSRLNPVQVEWARPATELTSAAGASSPVTEADRALVAACVPEDVQAKVLIVRTSSPGDRSMYVLRLLGAAGAAAPAGFDVPLAQAPFTFAVDCPAGTVRSRPELTPPVTGASPVLDYLARDYEALRTRLLDRIAVLLPDWTDRSPADIGVTLIELFAYLGDRLSYRQDAVAQEGALSTARRRVSIRRHARLLDYHVHEGCSARTWLAFTTRAEVRLQAGTAVGEGAGVRRPSATYDAAQAAAAVFETCHSVVLTRARNRLLLHAWGEADHVLPAGARSAFVALPPGEDPALHAGDVLVLAELDGDPTHRYAVRLDREPVEHVDALPASSGSTATQRVLELHWHRDDALPFPLRISRAAGDEAAVALANIVLADHGASVHDDTPVPAQVPWHGSYRPFLRRAGLAWAVPADPGPLNGVPPGQGWESASAALRPDPRRAVAQLELDDGARCWLPRPDLLDSARAAAHVVVETEDDRTIRLRFGDGIAGRRPTPGTTMTLRYRLGGGSWGNVGVDTLTELLSTPSGASLDGITVTNPLPAAGGLDPQPMAEVRELAPRAFRTRLQAVTSEDYAAIAGADSAVRQAVAFPRWTGSWYAQEVVVDPDGRMDKQLFERLAGLLEVRRTAGVDVEFTTAVLVPVEISIVCCLDPATLRAQAEQRLREVLSASVLPDGRRGLFHPDDLGFGSSLYLSDLIAQAMSVPGVVQVHVERFCRAGADTATNGADLARGRLDASRREILCCRSDPDSPETGFVNLVVRGGT
ncbi:hypothetical protein ABT040_29825 [Streptomyces sp. NPDC002688]|uniref:hypothetical protein n=1 Tax=Streptomyces sp. NPDC002688 TaxID=3154423 RepID=UPI00332A660E